MREMIALSSLASKHHTGEETRKKKMKKIRRGDMISIGGKRVEVLRMWIG